MMTDCQLREQFCFNLLAPTFVRQFVINPLMLGVYAYRVESADIVDVNPLPAANQANWILKCDELGNSSGYQYRNGSGRVSNVIKVFSRNVMMARNVWNMEEFTQITPINVSQLTFALTNFDNTAPTVSGTTQSIQFVITFLKTNQ